MSQKIIINDFVGMSKKADEHKSRDKSVVNATVGVLTKDNGKLFTFQTLSHIIKNVLNNEQIFEYPNIDGGEEFHENILKYTFQKHYSWVKSKFYPSVCAAIGGTGCLHLALKTCIDKKNYQVLLPQPSWSNYTQIIETALGTPRYYDLFDKNLDFNINAFITESKKILKTQDKLIIILNAPADNPNGYSLTNVDWKKLITYLNSLKKLHKSVDLIIDPAYLDFQYCDYEKTRDFFLYLKSTATHINNFICFSGSKSFASYGLRSGAMISLATNQAKQEFYKAKTKSIARSTWSEGPMISISLINTLFANKKYTNSFYKDLYQARKLIHKRMTRFLNEAKQCRLVTSKYHGGYFVSIPCDDPQLLYNALVKDKIYAAPFYKCIRIAISNVPEIEVKGLAARIKKAVDSVS